MADPAFVQAAESCAELLRSCAPAAPRSAGPPWWWGILIAPLVSAALTLAVGYLAIRIDLRKAINQELIRKRIAVFDEMTPKLNDMVCFFTCVGDWSALSPSTLLAHKRALDRARHIHGPLFSAAFGKAYDSFMEATFRTFTGRGRAALLKGNVERIRKQWGPENWDTRWETRFVPHGEATPHEEIKRRYDALMRQFAAEIGVRSFVSP